MLAAHPTTVIGWLLLIVGLLVYLGIISISITRVHRQYSAAMPGRARLRTGTAFAAAGKFWPFLLAALVGAGILIVGR